MREEAVNAGLALVVVASAAAGIPPLLPEGPPQLQDPVKVFFDAEPHEGDLVGGVLVCRVDIVGDQGWDTFGAVDLLVTFSLGGRAPVEVWGPEDRSSAVVTLPAAQLKVGEKLKLHIEDRDLTEREPVSRGHVVYAGKLPLRLDLDDTQVECRGIPRASAEERARPARTRAERALAAIDAAAPDLLAPELGLSYADVASADRATSEAEAWLGSYDPGVTALKERRSAALERFERAARDEMKAVKVTLPPPGASFPMATLGLSGRVVAGPVVTLEVTALSDVTLSDDDIADRVTLLAERGRVLEVGTRAVVTDATGEPRELAKGQVHVVRLKPASSPSSGGHAQIARVDGVLVRLR